MGQEVYLSGPPFGEMISRLVCLRGISHLSALTICSEAVDFARFASPEEFAAFVGLVRSEYSSGRSEGRGSITKTGNAHLRRVLVEAAWHYRHQAAVGANLYRRSQGQPPEVLAPPGSCRFACADGIRHSPSGGNARRSP